MMEPFNFWGNAKIKICGYKLMTTAGDNTRLDTSLQTRAGRSHWARAAVGTALFGALAISGNALNVDLFFGVNFLFGTIFVWLCLTFLGPIPATITAVVSAWYTVFLWGHHYAFFIFLLEFACVLVAGGQRNPSRFAIILVPFWLLIGAPLSYFCYKYGLLLPLPTVSIVVSKQILNSLCNACIATLIYNLLVGLRLPGEAIDRLIATRKLAKPSYVGMAQALIALVVLFPVIVTEFRSIRKDFDSRIVNVVNSTSSMASRLRDHALPHLEMETKLWGMFLENQETSPIKHPKRNLDYVTEKLAPEGIFRIKPDGSHKQLVGIPQVTENNEVLPGITAGNILNTPPGFDFFGCHADGVVTTFRYSTLAPVLVFLWSPSNISYLAPQVGSKDAKVTCPQEQLLNTRFAFHKLGTTKLVRSPDEDLPALVSWQRSSVVSLQSLKHDGPAILIEMKLRPIILEFQQDYATFLKKLSVIVIAVIVFGALVARMLQKWLNRYSKETEYFLRSGKVSKRALQARFLEDRRAVQWVKRVEANFRDQEEHRVLARRNFTELVRNSKAPIFATDRDGLVQIWNESIAMLTGFRLKDVVGQPISEFVSKATIDKFKPFLKAWPTDTHEAFEFCIQTRDKKNVFLLGGSTIIQDLSSVVGKNTSQSQSNDADLNYIIAQDITAQKAAQDKLLHTARLAALGEMAATFAHELTQPLNTISLAAGNGREYLDLGEKGREMASEKFVRIEDQAIRAGEVIRTIRAFVVGRTDHNRSGNFDAIKSFNTCVNLLEEHMRISSTKIELLFSNTPVNLKGQAVLFEQGVIAVLTNSIQALTSNPANQRNITVWTETMSCLDCHIACPRHKRANETRISEQAVKFVIKDNGVGIPETLIDHIFDPYVSTKSQEGGTGIGLYMARSAFESIGGRITAEKTSVGAKFEICLPVYYVRQETPACRGDK